MKRVGKSRNSCAWARINFHRAQFDYFSQRYRTVPIIRSLYRPTFSHYSIRNLNWFMRESMSSSRRFKVQRSLNEPSISSKLLRCDASNSFFRSSARFRIDTFAIHLGYMQTYRVLLSLLKLHFLYPSNHISSNGETTMKNSEFHHEPILLY